MRGNSAASWLGLRRALKGLGASAVALLALACLPCAPAGAVQITEFALPPGSAPYLITAGPDGNMWFTNPGTNTIGKITMAGEATAYSLGLTPKASLASIAAGPDGNLWFTERDGKRIGRITPSGAVTEFTAGLTGPPDIFGITAGPDGAMWFTETDDSRVGRIDPFTGAVKEFPVPAGTYTDIVSGPDGNLWISNVNKGTIVRLTPAGVATSFGPLPATSCAAGFSAPCPYPKWLAVGPDGNIWFTEERGNAIGRVTMTGGIAEYTSGLTHSARSSDLTAGPDGNIWFTEKDAGQIGRITQSGTITEFSSGLTEKSGPTGIAVGPDQNLWVTESNVGKIARVIPDVPPIVATGGPASIKPKSAIVTGTVRPRGAPTSFFFEYGETAAYGRASTPVAVGAGDDTLPVSGGLTKLAQLRGYHYRIVASNPYGTSYGQDMTLATTRIRKPRKRKKVSVGPFKFYFAGALSRGRLNLTQLNVIKLKRGYRVSYRCKACAGRPAKGSAKAKRSELKFRTRLSVSASSKLTIEVRAKDGSKRVRTYGFRPQRLEHFLKRERCFLAKRRKPVSCSPKKGKKGGKSKGAKGKKGGKKKR